jgi:hypothetical protein
VVPSRQAMKVNKNPDIKVNICYEIKDERKCLTLSKDEAYALRKAIEEQNGCVWWYQPVN